MSRKRRAESTPAAALGAGACSSKRCELSQTDHSYLNSDSAAEEQPDGGGEDGGEGRCEVNLPEEAASVAGTVQKVKLEDK
jgi:hypothetical protein